MMPCIAVLDAPMALAEKQANRTCAERLNRGCFVPLGM